MSLSKINNFANDDTDILAVQTTVDALYQNSYSLTEYDSTTVPAIAAGSKIEVNGSFYRASSEEAISTTDPVTSSTVADGTVYICMIPSGDASTCTAAFTATAPTWSDSKQGWYGTGGQANYKYIGFCVLSSGSYIAKKYIQGRYLKQGLIFSAYQSSYEVLSSSPGTNLSLNTIEYDPFSRWNNSTKKFTADEPMFVNVFANPITIGGSGSVRLGFYIRQYNSSDSLLYSYYGWLYDVADTATTYYCSSSHGIYLDSGDYITFTGIYLAGTECRLSLRVKVMCADTLLI